jgi:hypothetical protein
MTSEKCLQGASSKQEASGRDPEAIHSLLRRMPGGDLHAWSGYFGRPVEWRVFGNPSRSGW